MLYLIGSILVLPMILRIIDLTSFESIVTGKQIDRACSAQSPDMLPEVIDTKRFKAAQDRVAEQVKQYQRPVSEYI